LSTHGILAIVAVAAPAGDKGNHSAAVVLTSLLIVFVLVVIAWAIWRRRKTQARH
jgi:membrane protein DedA with SNARE-associated domain